MPVYDSVSVVKQDNTSGVGTTVVSADDTGLTVTSPGVVKVDTNVIDPYLVVNVQVLAATVDQPIFIPAIGTWTLDYCSSVRRVVGSDGSAVTADIMSCASGTAPASGTTCLASADSINLKSPAADVIANHTVATTKPEVGPGSMFSLNVAGTLTAVVALITCKFRRIR